MVTIDLFADIVCPWCLIGTRRLEQVLSDSALEVEVRYRPFYLMPETPAEGLDIADMLRKKYGREPRSMWDVVEKQARASGIALDLAKQPRAYQTAKAHTLLRHAAEKGTQRALATELYEAYFLRALNIDDVDVLAELAVRHGFSDAEARKLVVDPSELAQTAADAEEAVQRGVRGVPLFVFGERLVVSGAQPNEVLRQALERAAAASAG
jgi:predicted DsbA family dithiol-disulfide isomerase